MAFWNKTQRKLELTQQALNKLTLKFEQVENKKEQIGITKSFEGSSFPFFLQDNITGAFANDIVKSLLYYRRCSPLTTVVNRISDMYASIPFALRDKTTNQFVETHPVLDLLNNQPNDLVSGLELRREIARYYLITGNCYFYLTGTISTQPLEIWSVSPRYIQIPASNVLEFYPKEYLMTPSAAETNPFMVFKNKTINSTIRYIDQTNLRELIHLKDFNDNITGFNFYGMSRTLPLLEELEQYIQGNVNNLSLLKKGVRTNVAVVNDTNDALTQEQYDRTKEEIKKFEGSSNAGKTLLLDGFNLKEFGQNNKDMQFKELREAMKISIANIYAFPLALFSEKTMTLNNLQTSKFMLATDASIPLADIINAKLTRVLLPRFKNTENLEFAVNVQHIDVLQSEIMQNALIKSRVGVSTVNEIREDMGDNAIPSGDELVRAGTTAPNDPISNDTATTSPTLEDEDSNRPSDDSKDFNPQPSDFDNFKAVMDGKGLDVDEIEALWLNCCNIK